MASGPPRGCESIGGRRRDTTGGGGAAAGSHNADEANTVPEDGPPILAVTAALAAPAQGG
jgi:hypothetical protein